MPSVMRLHLPTFAPASTAPSVEASACRISVVPAADLPFVGWPTNRSAETTGYVFQSLEFVTLWCETIGPRRGARGFGVIVTLADDTPLLYLPLAVETRLGLTVLRFMDGGVAAVNAPILAGDMDLAPGALLALWPLILRSLPPVDAVDLGRIPGQVKDRRNPLVDLAPVDGGTRGGLIDIAGQSFDDYAATKARRAEIGKIESRRRQMARLGPVSFTVAGSTGEAAALFETLIALRRRQWLQRHGHDRFEATGQLAFYRGALAEGRLGKLAEIAAERCGDTVTATLVGFIEPDRFWFALTAHETETYGRFSSSARLLVGLIRRSFALGHGNFDLGADNPAYQELWSTRPVPLLDHSARVTWRGPLYFALKSTRRTFATWRRSDFAKWARALLAPKTGGS